MKRKGKRIVLEMSVEQKAVVKALAKEAGMSVSAWLRDRIHAYLQNSKNEEMFQAASPFHFGTGCKLATTIAPEIVDTLHLKPGMMFNQYLKGKTIIIEPIWDSGHDHG